MYCVKIRVWERGGTCAFCECLRAIAVPVRARIKRQTAEQEPAEDSCHEIYGRTDAVGGQTKQKEEERPV